jgi:hypothetical protein
MSGTSTVLLPQKRSITTTRLSSTKAKPMKKQKRSSVSRSIIKTNGKNRATSSDTDENDDEDYHTDDEKSNKQKEMSTATIRRTRTQTAILSLNKATTKTSSIHVRTFPRIIL